MQEYQRGIFSVRVVNCRWHLSKESSGCWTTALLHADFQYIIFSIQGYNQSNQGHWVCDKQRVPNMWSSNFLMFLVFQDRRSSTARHWMSCVHWVLIDPVWTLHELQRSHPLGLFDRNESNGWFDIMYGRWDGVKDGKLILSSCPSFWPLGNEKICSAYSSINRIHWGDIQT